MKISRVIIYVLAVSVLFSSMWGCAKKEDRSEEETDSNLESKSPSSTDDSQIIKPGETTSQPTTAEIEAKAEKEAGKGGAEGLEKQVEEVRRTFISLQKVCKANDIEGYLDFWDYEIKMSIDGRDWSRDERRERMRKFPRRPGTLQEIANAKIESITVDTTQAEKTETLLGVEIKGTMMLVRTNGLAYYLFRETAKGWKLFTIAPPEYFR